MTISDACQEYAWNAGEDCPDRPWILTPWDSWVPNPHYQGDHGTHPEDYID
jgi:hypothetical protein